MRAEARVHAAGAGTLAQPGALPLLRLLGWCVAVSLISAALLPVAPRLVPAGAPLTLEVTGEFQRVRPDAVRAAAAPWLAASFYRLDLEAVKHDVQALPWVARARVERAWPGTVRVHVWEHRPYALWGDDALLSGEGVVFVPPAGERPAGLPELGGPPGQERRVREVFEELRAHLAGSAFEPVRLVQGERGEWTAVTVDGIELRLGRASPLDAMAQLAGPVRTALEGRLQEVAYVDLHYINGFAVGWRAGGPGSRDPGADPPEGGGG